MCVVCVCVCVDVNVDVDVDVYIDLYKYMYIYIYIYIIGSAQEHDPQPRPSGGLKLSFRKEDVPPKSEFQDYQITSLSKWPAHMETSKQAWLFVPLDSVRSRPF